MSPSNAPDRAVMLGRSLLSVPFIIGALHALIHPGPLPDFARRSGLPQPELATKLTAGVMLGGAIAVGSGIAPVAGGTILAGSLVATTAIVHSFWRDTDASARSAHQKAFVANCGLLGGVIVTTAHSYGLLRARRGQRSGRAR
jgi:putative oxidoreductase